MNRTYEIPLDQCFNALRNVLTVNEVVINDVFQTERRINACWNYVLPRFNVTNRPYLIPRYDLEAQCVPLGDNSTEVRLTYRPDLTPAIKRPMQSSITVQAIIKQKLQDIHTKLSITLGVAPPDAPPKVSKFTRISQKWLWFDWVTFCLFAVPLAIILHINNRSTVCIGLLIDFGVGSLLYLLYHYTIHRLWVHLLPQKYTEWVCSNCKNIIPPSSSQCLFCLRDFED